MAEMAKGKMRAITAVAAILSSVIMNKIGEKKSIVWLKEWALESSLSSL